MSVRTEVQLTLVELDQGLLCSIYHGGEVTRFWGDIRSPERTAALLLQVLGPRLCSAEVLPTDMDLTATAELYREPDLVDTYVETMLSTIQQIIEQCLSSDEPTT